jgi:hypothetical protein
MLAYTASSRSNSKNSPPSAKTAKGERILSWKVWVAIPGCIGVDGLHSAAAILHLILGCGWNAPQTVGTPDCAVWILLVLISGNQNCAADLGSAHQH